jgi:hypothetical protein
MADEVEALGLGAEVVRGPDTLRHSFVLHDCTRIIDAIMERLTPRSA